jgi:hypothetical protein
MINITNISLSSLLLLACVSAVAQQQQPQPQPQPQPSATVQLETTISGNQEQPKTIYILPWQSPVSLIRIPGQPLQAERASLSPLDRQQFLRFVALQQSNKSLPISQPVN